MATVLDYVGRPGAGAIKGAGHSGAMRYIINRAKGTDASELASFTAFGLGMGLIFEDTVDNWRGGRTQGQIDALRARRDADAIGFPKSRPIYFAVDRDVVTAADFEAMLDYLRGAGSVLGAALVGVYGEADVIDRARDTGVASWFWQTLAWSHNRRTRAHLLQHVGYLYVGGVQCDRNEVLADDWGQHNYKGVIDVQLTDQIMDPHTGQLIGNVNDVTAETNKAAWRAVDLGEQMLVQQAALAGALTVGQAATLAAIAGVASEGPVTPEQWTALQERFVAEVGPDLAAEFGRRLLAGASE